MRNFRYKNRSYLFENEGMKNAIVEIEDDRTTKNELRKITNQ